MVRKRTLGIIAIQLALWAATGFIGRAPAQTLVEHSAEVRMQLDFAVPDAALRTFLPVGWEPNVATSGAAKDCNLRMSFIDRIDITNADGSPAATGSNQLVYLAIPIKQPATNTVGQMVIFGLTADPKDTPGPFGVYTHADSYRVERSTSVGAGKEPLAEEHWEFATSGGERLELHLKYERGVGRRNSNETKFFSSTDPNIVQVFKIEQGLDIMRNATVNVRDRVKEFQYKAAGGKLAALFDGTERVLSIDAFPWYNRAMSAP